LATPLGNVSRHRWLMPDVTLHNGSRLFLRRHQTSSGDARYERCSVPVPAGHYSFMAARQVEEGAQLDRDVRPNGFAKRLGSAFVACRNLAQ
jgi:hypothetical protein